MQTLDEELKVRRKVDKTMESTFIVTKAQKDQSLVNRFHEWWNHYHQTNDSPVTDSFYGYSITVCECPFCHCSTYSMSAFNTIHMSLLLTHIRVSVYHVFQFWNSQVSSLQETFVKYNVILPPMSTVKAIRDWCIKKYDQPQLTCYCVCYTNINGEEKVCIKTFLIVERIVVMYSILGWMMIG